MAEADTLASEVVPGTNRVVERARGRLHAGGLPGDFGMGRQTLLGLP